tara:strand:+ start:418 stop:699 length:282 start_codon:yes stop_codon:yes gene_type:complete
MNDINKLEKEKLLKLLECNIEELDLLISKSSEIPQKSDNKYDIILKVLQQGFNIREAVLSAITIGETLGYEKAKLKFEEEIKEKLYRAFKNSQ